MICAGIDAGSRTVKAVLIDGRSRQVIASACAEQGVRQDELAGRLLDGLLAQAQLSRSRVGRIVATGYARNIVRQADTTFTEITCHARGVHQLLPAARTVIEIGGQDSKLLWLERDGAVRDFAMNDRCAAGTGRFLELVAQRLGLRLEDLGPVAAGSRSPAAINSMCAVFAETEIIGLLAGGAEPPDIVAGVQAAIASRVAAMAGGALTEPVAFTGGVAMVGGMDKALEAALGQRLTVAPQPLYTGALGAALLASERTDGGSP